MKLYDRWHYNQSELHNLLKSLGYRLEIGFGHATFVVGK